MTAGSWADSERPRGDEDDPPPTILDRAKSVTCRLATLARNTVYDWSSRRCLGRSVTDRGEGRA